MYLPILAFLPSGIDRFSQHKMMDGNVFTIVYIPVLEHILNFIAAFIIHLLDFCLWFVSFIPFLGKLSYILYRSPDFDLMLNIAHRHFISHSVLNPIFLIYVAVLAAIAKALQNIPKYLALAIKAVLVIVCLSFAGHLLADSMPGAWKGFALIQIAITKTPIITLPAAISKLWFYANSILAVAMIIIASAIYAPFTQRTLR